MGLGTWPGAWDSGEFGTSTCSLFVATRWEGSGIGAGLQTGDPSLRASSLSLRFGGR